MRIWVGFCVFVIAVTGLAFLLLRAQIQLYQNGFLYAYGPYEFTRSIQELSMQIDSDNQQFSADAAKTAHPDWTGGAFLNRHSHSKVLADQTFRSVTTPNNDTLYTSAVLELSATPVELVLPAIGGRYQSVALMDLFTDQFAHIGPRETGGEAGVYWIIGPEDDTPVPANVKVIRATGNDVWLLGRTFVSGAGDLDAARAAQSGMTVRPVFPDRPTRPFSTLVTDITDSANFLAVTNEALARNSHHPHSARADQYKAIGIGPDAGTGTWSDFLWARLTARIEAAMSEQINQTLAAGAGWSKPSRTIGFYGEDDTFRCRPVDAHCIRVQLVDVLLGQHRSVLPVVPRVHIVCEQHQLGFVQIACQQHTTRRCSKTLAALSTVCTKDRWHLLKIRISRRGS